MFEDTSDPIEYKLRKSKPTTLHLARMPENFRPEIKPNPGNRSISLEHRNLIIKKLKVGEDQSKDYIMDDLDDTKVLPDNTTGHSQYKGKENKSNSKFLVFYRKDNEIMVSTLTSIVSFTKEQQLKSSGIEKLKQRRGGRAPSLKTAIKATMKKEEEEKAGILGKDDEDEDDDTSVKSWEDSGAESSDEENGAGRGRGKKKAKAFANIKDLDEPLPMPVEQVKREPAAKDKGKATADKDASDESPIEANDNSDNDSDTSSIDFE